MNEDDPSITKSPLSILTVKWSSIGLGLFVTLIFSCSVTAVVNWDVDVESAKN